MATVTSAVTGEADVPVDATVPRQYFRVRAWMAP